MTKHTARQAILRITSVLALCVVSALPIACDDDDDPVDGGNGTFDGTIDVRANSFSPATATISQGDSVTWVWVGGAGTHTVTEGTPPNPPSPLFDSPQKSSGTFGYRFNIAGTYPYFCRVHGASMSGTIIVEP
ncbi:MAG TPA: plastocyanin/azurin family copper-binding protein [Candidatus Krumholzibacteria bacterium]|nr:plastocyanin/azurin family copper-binding protein [Candidatus Krumholzibacteria bacterium]